MHYLVTGGTGFIGSALCAALRADGDAVCVLTRDAIRARAILAPDIELIEKFEAAQAIDAVVNLAGASLADGRWNEARKQQIRASRIDTTRHLVEWIAAQPRKPAALISGSAIGWYGARGDEAIDESAAPGEDFPAQLCRDWEAEAMRAQALGVRVCLIRTGIVFDRDGGALAKMLPPFRLGLGGPFGDGRQWMSWVARADIVALIRWLADDADARGVYNATAPAPVTNKEFAATLGEVLRRPALLPVPAFVLRLGLGEMAQMLLTGQRVVPARARAEGFAFRYPDLRAALSAIL